MNSPLMDEIHQHTMKSAAPAFTFFLIVFVGLILFSSCNDVKPELKERMLEHLSRQNSYLKKDFVDTYSDNQRNLENMLKGGNRKYEYLRSEFVHVSEEVHFSEADFDRMMAAIQAGEDIRDSIKQVVSKWSRIKKEFCSKFRNEYNDLNLNCDSSAEKTLAEVDHLFSTNNKSTLALELEMQRSSILQDAIDMVTHLQDLYTVCNGSIDSLALFEYPIETSVEAGQDAQIGLSVHLINSSVKPEFEGSGKITFDQIGSIVILHVKTSESMIPAGQNEAFVPYKATAKVPRANGELISLTNHSKIKIRRPCKTQ